MRAPRRWVPAPTPRHADGVPPQGGSAAVSSPRRAPKPASDDPEHDAISPRDLMFCAEFAVHGGVAESAKGFAAEGALLRMRRHGLLELERGADPPFAVTRVALTTAAWERLSASVSPRYADVDAGRGRRASAPPWRPDTGRPDPGYPGAGRPDTGYPGAGRRTGQGEDPPSLRRGFEVARGLIGAAVKAELLAWRARAAPDGAGQEPHSLEQRIMTRIGRIAMPFDP